MEVEKSFTRAGGGEHGQCVGVVVLPAIPLNKLLLTLYDAKSCCQSGIKHKLHSCVEKRIIEEERGYKGETS